MDKYEYRLKSEEIQRLIDSEEYAEAAEIADSIDWRRVKSATMLQKIAALYRVNRRNEDSKEILMLAYDRYPTNRSVLYSLCEVSIELDEVVQAIEFYKEFVRQAPRDNGVFTLRYKILEAQEASLEERIELLEELKKRDYQEEWGYELAYLYHRVGLVTKCVEECDDIILWFGDGPIVMKAMELKMLHAPLTKVQQQNYEAMKRQQEQEAQGYNAGDENYQDEYSNGEYAENYGEDQYQTGGYVQEGYGEDQYQADGYAQEGYGEDQYQADGYSQEGYGEDQYQADGYVQEGYGEDQYQADGYVQEGYGEDQYQADGYSQEGYGEDQYQADGYSQEGYQSDVYYQDEAYGEPDEDNFSSSVYQQDVPTNDLSQYNTINLQKVIADGMNELYEKDKNLFDTSKDLLQPQHIEETEEAEEPYSEEFPEQIEENVYNDSIDQAMEAADYMEEPVEESQFTMPEMNPILEKKNTGEMYVKDVLTEWERMKKDAEEKRLEEVRQRVLQETGSILQNFETAATSGLLAGLEVNPDLTPLTEDELQEALQEEATLKEEPVETARYAEEIEEEPVEAARYAEEVEEELVETAEYAEETEEEPVEAAEYAEETEEEPVEPATYAEEVEEELVEAAEYAEETEEEPVEATEYADTDDEVEELAEIEPSDGEDEITSYMEAIGDSEDEDADEAILFQPSLEENEDEMQAAIEEDLEEKENILKTAKKNLDEVTTLSDALEEDALGQRNSSSKIMMDTAEISGIEQRIIETTKKETSPAKEEVRDFTEEEAELFDTFAQTKKVKKQIINALDKISLASYTGNVLITGEPGLGTIELAKNLLKEVQATDSNFSGKVAKITGEKLNLKNLEQTFQKLNNGALLIEKANGCTEECLYNMSRILDQEDRGIIIIMEDTRHNIMQLLKKQALIADYFNIRIDLVEMNNDALVAYAKNYALEQEYSIDELGILALYTRIADIQAGNHVVTVEEVKDIVDEAIWNSKRFKVSNFVDVLFAKRYDEDDMIVLRERDFI